MVPKNWRNLLELIHCFAIVSLESFLINWKIIEITWLSVSWCFFFPSYLLRQKPSALVTTDYSAPHTVPVENTNQAVTVTPECVGNCGMGCNLQDFTDNPSVYPVYLFLKHIQSVVLLTTFTVACRLKLLHPLTWIGSILSYLPTSILIPSPLNLFSICSWGDNLGYSFFSLEMECTVPMEQHSRRNQETWLIIIHIVITTPVPWLLSCHSSISDFNFLMYKIKDMNQILSEYFIDY